ncbi:MAG: hypothetical protein P8J20_03595 [Novosphingobium sp.]|nr:hypothetical protein [Novosphingobium sp.]
MVPILPALLLLAACAGATPPPKTPGCYEGPCIALGESQQFGIMRVTPLEVLADSRCPIEAECVWAGELRVNTQLDIGHETITVELKAYEPFTINGGTLLLAEVAPDASSQWPKLGQRDYAFRFTFTESQ